MGLKQIRPRLAIIDTRAAKLPGKTTDPHYLTPEHREWREKVIANAPGGRCQDPLCKTPNRIPSRLFADHIDEKKDGGALFDPANGLARCGSCHTRKTAGARSARMGVGV